MNRTSGLSTHAEVTWETMLGHLTPMCARHVASPYHGEEDRNVETSSVRLGKLYVPYGRGYSQ